jgi:hypothetical protein
MIKFSTHYHERLKLVAGPTPEMGKVWLYVHVLLTEVSFIKFHYLNTQYQESTDARKSQSGSDGHSGRTVSGVVSSNSAQPLRV